MAKTKGIAIGLVIAVLLLIGGGFYYFGSPVSQSTVGEMQDIGASCQSTSDCSNYLKTQGASDSDISKIQMSCNQNRCMAATVQPEEFNPEG